MFVLSIYSRCRLFPQAGAKLGTSTSTADLAAKTVPAAMGEVTAFLSHAWRDEDEAPGAKHALVSRWVRRHKETVDKEPTLWLVALAQQCLSIVYVDEYCIDDHARTIMYMLWSRVP